MIQLAFKIAAKTGSAWSQLIARESGSIYSHVEGWLDGPQNNARCFSSREPHGAGFEQIDLTVPGLWDTIPFVCTPEQEALANGFCLGADGKMYDGVGLLGYGLANASIHDYHSLFCSETWAAIAQKCCRKTLPRAAWLISPGELFDLVKVDFK